MQTCTNSFLLAAGLFVPAVLAQPCDQHWEAVGTPAGTVTALGLFDAGAGTSLYAGGTISQADGSPVSNLVSWDGSAWHDVAGGVAGGTDFVRAITPFDDGNGLALYVGGGFTMAGGGVDANRIARLDGDSWTPLGSGVDDIVRAMVPFDEDGDGPMPQALFAAGAFTTAGGSPAMRIARWDGKAWSDVGGGVGDGTFIRALAVFDDGGGSALYAAGTFTMIGGVAANNIARWDGTSWTALGDGISGGVGAPGVALTVWDDGGGPDLYVAGELTSAGGQPANLVARWDGKSWSTVGDGITGTRIRALAGWDDGSGPALYAGGEFPGGSCSRWDGATWSSVGSGVDSYIVAMRTATEPQYGLYIGGAFSMAGGNPASNVALWTACAACLPDCDGSGGLDLFDFLCFTNAFNAQEDYADCDGDAAFSLFDFLCFVNAFNAGC